MHWYTASSVSSASFLLVLFVACHCASLPRIPKPYATSTQRGSRYLLSSTHTAYSSHQLKPRVSDLTLIHFDQINTISPIATAAQVLVHFYSEIYYGAQGPWANIEQRIWVKVTFGSFQLLMSATEGHTVPWSFVKWWALQMLQRIDKGHVATYDAYFATPEGEAGVIISLTCRAIGALTSAAAVAVAANGDANGHRIGNGGQPLNPNARPYYPP